MEKEERDIAYEDLEKRFARPELLDWKTEVGNELVNDLFDKCKRRLGEDQDLDWVLFSERFSNVKLTKNTLTLSPSVDPTVIEDY